MHKWDPESYEKSSSPQKEWAEELLARIIVKGEEKILDIGSGDGKITAKISLLVPQGSVIGIDNSYDMVIFAQKKYPKSIWPNLSFQHGDASDLKFENEFDLVTSFACLHWILNQRPVLAGIRRCLRPGGKVFLQFGGKGNAAEILEVAEKLISSQKWSRYFQDFEFPYGFFGIKEYRRWLDQSGLRTIRIELIPKEMILPDLDSLSSWIEATWLPYTSRVPEKLRYEFIHEIAKGYFESNPSGKDNKLHLKMVRLEVEAEKP